MREIDYKTAVDFLLPRHYSGRIPNISKAFGWFENNKLMAVCTFGKPASPALCRGVCGEEYSNYVYELNRLCREDDFDGKLSQFVAWCLRQIRDNNWIIVSYSDTAMNHHGYIYQACNFLYTGSTCKRTDMYTIDNKHSRHYKHKEQTGYRKVRSPKHRYIYFCTKDKKLKKKYMEALRYHICPYPKGDNNSNYKLGEYLKPEIIKDGKSIVVNSISNDVKIKVVDLWR